ncbi:thiamine diphosphokinase [Brevibacillus panacihumi]|uniref:Thiamine diphosphokinase n=1 Tax=Brevibacillus panacihumi TaxID=497735 RepID=A0A3M8CFE7_9BACL|nr:thiamine diphosphokinase [Brevibacillus panacihumi]RNB74456.1 thiamine diphosphokinase [Brevibacillus panacihumi]
MKSRRILLFAGGNLGDWALRLIQEHDVLVGVDRGAWFLIDNGHSPHLSIGDFDSVTEEEKKQIASKSLQVTDCDPVFKDLTDTEMALQWAIRQQPAEILLIGVLGTRFDHTLANVHLLEKGLQAHIPCRIIDAHNEIRLITDGVTIESGPYDHLSLLPFSQEVTGITLQGFQYPLEKATLRIGDTLGISNVLIEPTGHISLATGKLLVIRSKD